MAMHDAGQVERWCYRGMSIFVPQGECELIH